MSGNQKRSLTNRNRNKPPRLAKKTESDTVEQSDQPAIIFKEKLCRMLTDELKQKQRRLDFFSRQAEQKQTAEENRIKIQLCQLQAEKLERESRISDLEKKVAKNEEWIKNNPLEQLHRRNNLLESARFEVDFKESRLTECNRQMNDNIKTERQLKESVLAKDLKLRKGRADVKKINIGIQQFEDQLDNVETRILQWEDNKKYMFELLSRLKRESEVLEEEIQRLMNLTDSEKSAVKEEATVNENAMDIRKCTSFIEMIQLKIKQDESIICGLRNLLAQKTTELCHAAMEKGEKRKRVEHLRSIVTTNRQFSNEIRRK